MGYGRSSLGAWVPVTFVCDDCALIMTLQVPTGKDVIWEETVRYAAGEAERSCEWTNKHGCWYCAVCVPIEGGE